MASASSDALRRARPPASRSLRSLLAAFGALVAVLAWLAAGELTGLGKLDYLLIPLAVVAAAAGALLALSRLRLGLWIGSGVALLIYMVVALTPFAIAVLPLDDLVRRDSIPRQRLDGVVVLSGGVTPDSLLMPEVVDRLLTGLAMMRDSVADVLVVTRARRRNGATADRDQQDLRSLVTRDFPLLFVDSVHTTRDEAVKAMELFQARGIARPRIAVVTSPLHTRRACGTFEGAGFSVTCVPATSRAYSVSHASSPEQRLGLFRRWLYESAAAVEYRSKGWTSR